MKPEYTLAQAEDLAKHFLGAGWFAMQLRDQCVLSTNSRGAGLGAIVGIGDSWREAFRNVGVKLPLRPQFVAKATTVMMAADAICTARSASMAKRIAAALNDYIPDRRGI